MNDQETEKLRYAFEIIKVVEEGFERARTFGEEAETIVRREITKRMKELVEEPKPVTNKKGV